MDVEFIAQPEKQLGRILFDRLMHSTPPKEVVFVSAFVALQTVLRLRRYIFDLKKRGTDVRLIVGIDMHGTSREVLKELSEWGVAVYIVKNRMPRATFHPKIYLLAWSECAEMVIGSNNLTEGGLFRNYEGSVKITYNLPSEESAYGTARAQLKRFLDPDGRTSRRLTPDYLKELLARPEIPSEAEASKARRENMVGKMEGAPKGEVFGYEEMPQPPRLPVDLQKLLIDARRGQLGNWKRQKARQAKVTHNAPLKAGAQNTESARPAPEAQFDPVSFYMMLPSIGGKKPGEARIPIEAIDMAQEFWGWPENYIATVASPRKGTAAKEERVYKEWKPVWHISIAGKPDTVVESPVRMYFYENSDDFRFYSRFIKQSGADTGDIVKISRSSGNGAAFECIIAKRGSAEYDEWRSYCVNQVQGNSGRWFGFT